MPKIKICGIQTVEHAVIAAKAGANFIGLVFVPNRRRAITTSLACLVINTIKRLDCVQPRVVGLFADQPLEEIERVVNACRLDMVQLCGNESLEYCAQATVPVIKVLHVDTRIPPHISIANLEEILVDVNKQGHMVVLDRLQGQLQGGTGLAFDWHVASELTNRGHTFILAGGLTPKNVSDAIRLANPWGLDVSSGVETKGIKDPHKIRQFIAEVHNNHPKAYTR